MRFFSKFLHKPMTKSTHRSLHMELAKQAMRDGRTGDAAYHLQMCGVLV
jgi:hypothetical protein